MHLSSSLSLLVGLAGVNILSVGAQRISPTLFRAGLAENAFTTYDEGLFTPFGALSALSSSEFTRLEHPAFPRHSLRVKKSNFCDGEATAYTGYIDVEARHLFFYFFESRHDPDQDDIIFWTNGGPGGSSSIGLFLELGPCRITSDNTTERFQWSWNEHANVFFVDQPVSVGFSYAEYGESVKTTKEAGVDIAAAMAIFFEHFTKFKGRALHLAGESYGGRYIPVFASTIYDQNSALVEAGVTPINLTSVMLGNGCTDFATMFPSFYDAQCADPLLPPTQNISTCVRLKQVVPRCEKRFKKSCVDTFDTIDCVAAANFCFTSLADYYPNRYNYDRTRKCTGEHSPDVCYPLTNNLKTYLSDPDTQALLGVDPAKRGEWSLESSTLSDAFDSSVDWFSFPAHFHLAALLERGVRALVYVGESDFSCNWIGNNRMTLGLEWTQQEAYRSQPLKAWTLAGKPAGLTRSGGGLTFATITGAGHLAPYDRPVESFEVVSRWLAGESL
ncbi:serine carboxypeptidase [Trametes elegans]|nr:serine carboxypeptidase [Trametes elegans]